MSDADHLLIRHLLDATAALSPGEVAEAIGADPALIRLWRQGPAKWPSKGMDPARRERILAWLARRSGQGALADAIATMGEVALLVSSARAALLAAATPSSVSPEAADAGRVARRSGKAARPRAAEG